MEVIQLTESLEEAYEEFLRSCEGSSLYYSVRYRRFLADLLRIRAPYWLAVESSEILGVLPMMAKEGDYGIVWNSLPYYGSHGGVLAKKVQARKILSSHYNSIVCKEEVAASTIVTNPFIATDESLIAFDETDQRIGQFVRLGKSPDWIDNFFLTIESSTRRNIKKASKSAVIIKIENGAMPFVEDCHMANMTAINGKAKDHNFFDLIPKHFRSGQDYNIYVAELDGKPIAALLLFYYNNIVEYFTPVILESYRAYQPLALIIYRAMTDAAQAGFTYWNWGGTWLHQEGVYKFKKKWNTVDVPYRYLVKINNKKLYTLSKDQILKHYEHFFVIPFNLLQTLP